MSLLNYFPVIKFFAYFYEIPSFRVQFVLLVSAKVHSSEMKFLVLGGSVVSVWPAWTRTWMPVWRIPYIVSLSREEACNRANDHQSAFRNLVRLLIRTCPRTHWRSTEWAGSRVVCSCCPFWRFPDKSSRELSYPKTLRHAITQKRSHSCMT